MSTQIIDEFCTLLQQIISLEEIDLEVDCTDKISNPMPILIIMETVCSLTLKKSVIRICPGIADNDIIMAICNVLENNKYLEYLHLPTLRVEPHQHFLLPIANALSKNSNLYQLIEV